MTLGLPGSGLSYRHRVTQPRQTESSSPVTPQRMVPTERPSVPLPDPPPPGETIQSSDIVELTSPDLSGLKVLLKEVGVERTRLATEAKRAMEARDIAWRRLQRASLMPLRLVFARRIPALHAEFDAAQGALAALIAEHDQCSVMIDFAFDDASLATWTELEKRFHSLASSRSIWDVTREASVDRAKTRSAAARAVNRTPVTLRFGQADGISSRWRGLCLENANGGDLEIFPGFCLVQQRHGNDFALVDLRELSLAVSRQRFIEEESVPADARIVGTTWEKVNRDGSRDRRFADNRELPIVEYGALTLRSPTGINEEYMVSAVGSVIEFVEGFDAHRRALAALAADARSESIAGHSPWLAASREVRRLAGGLGAPELPRVRAAHEYTVAAIGLLALVCAAAWGVIFKMDTRGQGRASAPFEQSGVQPLPSAHAIAPGRVQEGGSSPPASSERAVVQVTANVRAGPRGDATVLQTVQAGARLQVFDRQGNWVQVGDVRPFGWVHRSLLSQE